MKKHIAGFILFGFIIGIAVFFGKNTGVFTVRHSKTKCDFRNSYPNIKPETNELGAIDENSPFIRQAVFDLNSKQINLELIFPGKLIVNKNVTVEFSFYRKSAKGTRFLAREVINLVPDSFQYKSGDTSVLVVGSKQWLNNVDSYENLYVMAQTNVDGNVFEGFDPNYAKAILIKSDK